MVIHRFDISTMMAAMHEVFYDDSLLKSDPDKNEFSLLSEAIRPFHEMYFKEVQKQQKDNERFKVFNLFSITVLHFGIVCGMHYMMKRTSGGESETIH